MGGGGGRTLQGHDVSAAGLHHLGDHVVDESVLVPDLLLLELLGVGALIDLLEDVLKPAIVLLQDGVLGGQIQGQALGDGQLEGGVREARDGLVGVVLRLRDTAAGRELVHLDLLGLAALGGEDQRQLAVALDDGVLGAVLVAEGVAADDDGLLPAWD